MRSRSRVDLAGMALGAVTEGIWLGALAAVSTDASGAALAAFAGMAVFAAAFLTRGMRVVATSERVARLRVAALVLALTAMLLVAGRSWEHASLLWQVARDVAYAGGLVVLGLYLGRAPQSPEAASRRAIRGFALLCVVIGGAALAGSVPGWASGALVVSIVGGSLLVAIVRYQALSELVAPANRPPAWPWLLAVLGAVLVVVVVGALLSQVLRVDVLLWVLGVLGGVLRFIVAAVAFVLGYAGAGLLRGIAWLLGLMHVHAWRPVEPPHAAPTPRVLPQHNTPNLRAWGALRLVVTSVGALIAMGLSFALVWLALRRFRRDLGDGNMVLEERETLSSLHSAAGVLAARLARRLRGRLTPRRRDPRTPTGLVRRRYADLEHRLSLAGQPRLPGVTVRDYLVAIAASSVSGAASEQEPPVPEPPERATTDIPAATQPVRVPTSQELADLTAIYEVARYSTREVDVAQANSFEELARALVEHRARRPSIRPSRG